MPHTLLVDGLQVPDVSDAAKVAIEKLQGQVRDGATALDAANAKVGELTAAVATKDGEIAGLNSKLKDAEVTPQRLQELADERAKLIEDAKTIDPKIITDGKTSAEIKSAAVTARLGDAAKDMADAAIDGAFRALVGSGPATDPVRGVIAGGTKTVGDARADYDTARDAAKQRLRDAYKTPHSAAAA